MEKQFCSFSPGAGCSLFAGVVFNVFLSGYVHFFKKQEEFLQSLQAAGKGHSDRAKGARLPFLE